MAAPTLSSGWTWTNSGRLRPFLAMTSATSGSVVCSERKP